MSRVLFKETQRFRPGWLWALLLVSTVPTYLLVVAVLVSDAGGLGPAVYPSLVVGSQRPRELAAALDRACDPTDYL